MFCTKCGYNAGDAKFCPKCGNSLVTNQNQQVTDQSAQEQTMNASQGTVPEQTIDAQQQTQSGFEQANNNQQYSSQPYGGQSYASQPYGGQTGMPQETPKKRSKLPKIVGLVAAIGIILGVVGFFAYPYIQEMFSPKKQAVAALKEAGSDFESFMTESVNSMTTTSVSTKNQLKGSFELDSALVEGVDYLSYLKVDTVNYNFQMDALTGTASGMIGVSNGTGNDLLSIQFYTDEEYIYFKIPELFAESFRISISDLDMGSTGYAISPIGSASSALSYFDPSSLAQYTDVIEAAIKDIMIGFDTMIDNCTYKKSESSTYESENGDIKVSIYEVSLTEKALTEGMNAAIDALYDDAAISSYMALLGTMMGGSKDTLKASVQTAFAGMEATPFTMYVNNDDKIVKLIFNISDFDKTVDGQLSVEFIGKDNLTDYVVFQADIDGNTIKYVVSNTSDNKISFNLEVTPDQTFNSGEFLSVGAQITISEGNSKIDSLYLKGNIDGSQLDISMSGEMTTDTFSSMSLTEGSFYGYIDPTYLTEEEETELATELVNGLEVFRSILSDELYEVLFGDLEGISSMF